MRTTYRKNKEGKYTAPDERLIIKSFSYPQYEPYISIKSKNAKKQRTIKHEYDCFFAFSKNEDGNYSFWTSKVIFRIGGFKKWQDNVPQNKVKTVFKETRNRLERKYKKLPQKQKEEMIRREVEKIQKRGQYLDVGDYNSRVNGLNGDFYFRDSFIMQQYDCLYGRCWTEKKYNGIDFVFFPKHALACVNFLLKKGILKFK